MSARQWSDDFQRTKGVISQIQAELQRWELLGSQSVAGQRGSERASIGAKIRNKIGQLKIDLERLQRELERLSASSTEHDVTRKSITQFRDELQQAFAELTELQQRSKGSLVSSTASYAGSGGNGSSFTQSSPSSSFVRMTDAPGPDRGAEMAAVSNRGMIQRQQDMMKEFDEPLNAIEGAVDNLGRIGNDIHQEITLQNRMLDDTNETVSRTGDRLQRTRSMLQQVAVADRNRCLWCFVITLLITLVLILIELIT